jgi:DNA-binding winged helix-turn-helix (wHTH) protein
MQFHFSDHVLDAGLRELTRAGEAIAVEPQVFDLLIYLVENRDRVVIKDDLMETIWDGRIVSESTLISRINAARKAVGDSGKNQTVIRTIARKSFRFAPASTERGVLPQLEVSPPAVPSADPLHQHQLPLDRPAIAVLPFVNISGESEQEYFSEDIITALSKLRWFYVVARNSPTRAGWCTYVRSARNSATAMSSRARCARTATRSASPLSSTSRSSLRCRC